MTSPVIFNLMFKKVLGYHRQITVSAYRIPEGLKGRLEEYRILVNGKPKDIVMSPVGRNVYMCPFPLDWTEKPILVVHRRELSKGKWQVDEAVTGQIITSGHDTREAAAADAIIEVGAAGEAGFWKAQKAACRALRKAKVPLNKVEVK